MPSLSPEGCDSGPSLLFSRDTEHVATATFSCQGIYPDPRLVWHCEVLFVVRGYCRDTDVLKAVSIFHPAHCRASSHVPTFHGLDPGPVFSFPRCDNQRCHQMPPSRAHFHTQRSNYFLSPPSPCVCVFICAYVDLCAGTWVCVVGDECTCVCMHVEAIGQPYFVFWSWNLLGRPVWLIL